jgi:hypothetical protein
MTTNSQDVLRSQACIKSRQAAEMRSLPNRQLADKVAHELTARNLEYTKNVLLKDAKFLDQYHSGKYEFVQVAI